MSPQTERRLPDPNEPLTDWEKALLEKFFADPSQLPAKFKSWVADYVSTNGNFNVSSLPTLKGEEWRYVGESGQPAFSGSWANYDGAVGGTNRSVSFYKDVLGIVHLRGLCQTGSGAIFTLPAGYFPAVSDIHFAVGYWNGGYTTGSVTVSSNGTVTLRSAPATGAGLGPWLDGIHFRAA